MHNTAHRTIYLSQLEDFEEQKRLMQTYQVGFETYEFSMSHSLDDLQKSIERFAKEMAGGGSYGLSFHGPFLDLNTAAYDSKVRRATMERYEECYRAAKALNAKRIVYHSCFCPQVYWEESWMKNSLSFWKEFLQEKDDSIKIHMENLYDPDFTPLGRMVEEVGHPAFSLCVDVAHTNVFSRLPIEAWLEGLRGKVGHFHLSNNDGTADRHCALDEGTLDMEYVSQLLNRWYPDSSCTLEISSTMQAEHSLRLLDSLKLR